MKKILYTIGILSLIGIPIAFAAFETTNAPFVPNPSTNLVQLLTNNLQVGSGTVLPNAPVSVFGSGVNYVQMTLQNTFNGSNSSADFVVNNASSTNNSYFGDFGINDQLFGSSTYSGEGPGDTFLSSSDANLDLEAASTSKGVAILTGGLLQGNIRAFFYGNGQVSFGLGTSTASTTMQIATSTANATTTLTVGKDGQNKGSQIQIYDAGGAKHCMYLPSGSNTLTIITGSCNL